MSEREIAAVELLYSVYFEDRPPTDEEMDDFGQDHQEAEPETVAWSGRLQDLR